MAKSLIPAGNILYTVLFPGALITILQKVIQIIPDRGDYKGIYFKWDIACALLCRDQGLK
jgi:hypothetical protein